MRKLSTSKVQLFCARGLASCVIVAAGSVAAWAQAAPPTAYGLSDYAAPKGTASGSLDSGRDLGFYINGDACAALMPNFQSSRFGFPGNFRTDTGVRFGVEPGCNFLATDRLTLGGEFETGLIYNRLSSVRAQGSQRTLKGDYYQVPLLGNLVLTLHPNDFVAPYVGVGAGGDYSWAGIDSPGFSRHKTSSGEIDPALQALAGVRFRLNSRCDVGVGYKFLADFPDRGKYLATHAAMASFTMRF